MKFKQISITEILQRLLQGDILYCVYKEEVDDIEFYSYQYCMLKTKDEEKVYLNKEGPEGFWKQQTKIMYCELLENKWYIEEEQK